VSCSSRGERPTSFAADSGFAAEGMRREPAKVLVGEVSCLPRRCRDNQPLAAFS